MHVIPYGDRILVKRRTVGEKIGKEKLIYTADTTKDRPTDLADVIYVPNHSFADKELIENSESIIKSLTTKSMAGDSDSLVSLLRFNEYLRIKSIKPGDKIMIGKYVGIDFNTSDSQETLTLVTGEEVIGLVVDD